MGADLAVVFVEHDDLPSTIAGSAAVSESEAKHIFVVLGPPCEASANRPYFAIWSDERVDLRSLGVELSTASRVCISWKSEHGGVAGYVVFEHGQEIADESDSGDDYLLLPSRGVEGAFGVDLGLDDEARLAYPELLFDDRAVCVGVSPRTAQVSHESPATIQRLFEDELEGEPLQPLDTW